MNKMYSVKINGCTPNDRSLIIGNALKNNLTISKYVRDTVSNFILSCTESDIIKLLGKQKNRTTDVPLYEIKVSPSKIESNVSKKVYEKLHYLAQKLNVSKSIILYKVLCNEM